MVEAKIIDRGRGPRDRGDADHGIRRSLNIVQDGWRPRTSRSGSASAKDQVEVAIRYIEEHQEEVWPQYEKIMERINRGNPPELQAKLDAAHERFRAMLRELRRAKGQEAQDAGNSGGQ